MNNIMTINGQQAVISFDPEINLFRGEFVGLAQGGADFYAGDVKGLLREGKRSLAAYVEMCREDGVEPFQKFSGRFNARIPPVLHAKAKAAAAASGKSLNQWVAETLEAATV
ncbi:MAG: type II toxin-antitoxin system HicB family antitoxin [Burkholderiales bacterium]|jgi:predicted HicB family RNase H-like nuclease|nr:type II toxin-antitoxin system HicB family antitoxin [Burkholderiales bacterium]